MWTVNSLLGNRQSALLALAAMGGVACAACGGGAKPASGGPPALATEAGADSGATPRLAANTLQALRRLAPESLPAPAADMSNRFADDPTAAALGQRFFFDPGFSGALLDPDNIGDAHSLGHVGDTGKVACAGCHVPSAGFLDNRSTRAEISLGAGWGRRRTRSLLDIGQARVIMWDGRHDALYNQPFLPIETAFEMNSSRLYVAEQVYKRYRASYEAVFGSIPVPLDDPTRFPQLDGTTTGCRQLSPTNAGIDCHGIPGDKAEFDHLSSDADRDEVTRVVVNLGKALGAYERKLACGPSRFDAWVHGQADALTPAEQRGAALFVGQRSDGSVIVGCDSCHSGPFLTDQVFHNVGLEPAGVGPAGSFYDLSDHGAQEGLTAVLADPLNVKGKFSDGDDGRLPTGVPSAADGAFRTPSLRCVSRRPSFMHTAQFLSLDDVVAFFDRGGDSTGFPGTSENFARNFTAEERADLVAFLRALDGPGPSSQLTTSP